MYFEYLKVQLSALWESCNPVYCRWHLKLHFWKTGWTQEVLIMDRQWRSIPWPYSSTILPHSNTDICLSLPGSWFRLLKWQKSMYLLCCAGEPSWRGVLVPAQQRRGSKIVRFDTCMCHWLCCPKKLHPKESWNIFHLLLWTPRIRV